MISSNYNHNYKTEKYKSKQKNTNKQKLTPKEMIQLVKSTVSLEEGLDFYLGMNIQAVKAGRATKLIKCPFHEDKTASFAVTVSKNVFHCFSCHRKGDIVTLVSELKNVSQARAAYLIAEDFKLLQKADYKLKQAIKKQTEEIELKREFLQKEREVLYFLMDFRNTIRANTKARIKSLEDLSKFEKVYHQILPFLDMYIDLLSEAEDIPAHSRIKNYHAAQEFVRDKIYPIYKSKLEKEGVSL